MASGRTGTVHLVRQINAVVKIVAAHGRLQAAGQIAGELARTARGSWIRIREKRRRVVNHQVKGSCVRSIMLFAMVIKYTPLPQDSNAFLDSINGALEVAKEKTKLR